MVLAGPVAVVNKIPWRRKPLCVLVNGLPPHNGACPPM